MAWPDVPDDFKELLKLLNAKRVKYLWNSIAVIGDADA
jgi:hypothetical protein